MKDLYRIVENQRPTEQELEELFYRLAEQFKPQPESEDANELVSLAEIWESDSSEGFRGLSTGYASLDELTQGMAPGQVHVYFGDTGHGKSQAVQNIAVQVAESGIPVLFVGLEMTKDENRERFRDFGANVGTPILQPAEIDLDYKSLEPSIARGKEYGVELVIIDHLHMFENPGKENEANFLSAVCREIKLLAIRYNVPIILVSHLNEDKSRSGPPKLSDLKGSSSIKQIADVAIAIYNDGMVNDLNGLQEELLFTLRKNRRGRKRITARLNILENARLEKKPVFTG